MGEVRCNKEAGPVFQSWLEHSQGKEVLANIRVYKDTKIRLHFSKFSVLPLSRDTCFLDKPHQCAEYTSHNALKEEISIKEEL